MSNREIMDHETYENAMEPEFFNDEMGLTSMDWQRIRAWNQSQPECISSCIHSLIQLHVESRPEALAVCAWDGCFTYQELDRISSSIALKLVQRGVLLHSYVPMCLERSKWVPVVMISVMKAGAAVVPLDPTQPVHRLQEILLEVEARLVVTSSRCAALFSEDSHIIPFLVDHSIPMEVGEGTLPLLSPTDAALVMFTVSVLFTANAT
ncbi:non-ribosomal peptide synthetase [Phlyctema vagabunda]|uniref:Non-ribosomal peptide synthetase n=1 Tax=Phlyctema vagabunda TaxID=108571 RepID=A0ABR4P9U4_9HELO